MIHDDQRPGQVGLIRADNEGRRLALGRQAGVTLLGDESYLLGSGTVNGGNAPDLQVRRAL